MPGLKTEICERVGIEYPVFQAGMGFVARGGLARRLDDERDKRNEQARQHEERMRSLQDEKASALERQRAEAAEERRRLEQRIGEQEVSAQASLEASIDRQLDERVRLFRHRAIGRCFHRWAAERARERQLTNDTGRARQRPTPRALLCRRRREFARRAALA